MANAEERQLDTQRAFYWVVIGLAAIAVCVWAVGADGFAKLLDALAHLLGTIIWPAVVVCLVLRYGRNVGEFISSTSVAGFIGSIREGTFKGGPFEASFKREEIATRLTAAIATRELPRDPQGNPTAASVQAAEVAARAAQEALQLVGRMDLRAIQQSRGARILWVDDRPTNNDNERQTFEASGIRVELATSTEDALARMKGQRFDAVISDMGRPPDPRAGYTLLDRLRSSGDQTPYIIYAGSRSPEHQAEARRRGALGCTNRPSELFQIVMDAVRR